MSTPGRAGDGMRSRILGGVRWKIGTQVVTQGTRAVVAILLARLLTPFDFGVVGLALVFAALMLTLGDFGLGSALVHRKEITETDRSSVFWVSLFLGAVLGLLGVALSPLVAKFFGEPQVEPLFAALSAGFVLTALASTQSALLSRDMNFRALEASQMTATVLGGAIGVVAAAAGGGPWAIVFMSLGTAAVNLVLVWIASRWRPHLTFSPRAVKRLGSYSMNLVGYSLLRYFERNADNLLIGRFLGATALGIYSLSYNLMLYPVSKIGDPVRQVLFPAFSRMQDDPGRIAALWLRITRLLAVVTVPVMLGLIVAAPDFVPTVLGEQWVAAVPVVQVLAGAGLLLSLQSVNPSVLLALDRTEWLLRFSVVTFASAVAAFVIALPYGVEGVAAGFTIVNVFLWPLYTWLVARTVGISAWAYARCLSGVARASAVMAVSVLVVRLGLERNGFHAGVRLIAVVIVGVIVYVPVALWQVPELRSELRIVRERRRLRRRGDVAPLATSQPGTTSRQ